MVAFIKSDLEFILGQIVIAERHAAGESLTDILPNVQVPWGLRTVDGSFNNLVPGQEQFGAGDNLFPRMLDPVFRDAEAGTSYAQASGFVFDSQPRIISNLIVDQTANNPAAVAAAADNPNAQTIASPGLDGDFGTADDVTNLFLIPNVAPDGLGPSFNLWFVFFGQFFDHGLDLVTKGGSGTVFMPLQPDDPLFVPGSPTNFLVLTRATNQPGPDGVLGTADDVHEHENTTSPFVDQNQTYSSHPSHQVFLRAYELLDTDATAGVNLVPFATGNLITNRDLGADGEFGTADDVEIGGMATWAVVKAQARDVLGINLTDADFDDVPLLATDPYGNFIRGPNGFPQVVMRTPGADGVIGTADDGTELVEGNPAAPIELANAVRTGHQFLADIAFNAVPVFDAAGDLVPDADSIAGNPVAFDPTTGQNLEYDDELLDAHYMAGDGRVNENIGLTAVHAIFHSEHNRLAEQTKQTLIADAIATGDVTFLNAWLLAPVTAADLPTLDPDNLVWNGERLFQAAKFGTEMQYQHLVFEEFARTVQPMVDEFLMPTGYDTTIDPSIVAEFAHTVYRFGHSMLVETVDRLDADFNPVANNVNDDPQLGLIAAFLNPLAYATSGLTPEDATSAIVRGVTHQVGNEIDEFVTEALRSNLLGLPQDLAAINLARGRDAGIPSLNAARAQFYQATGDSQLKPYISWADFAFHLKHAESLVNFIAAYGTHPLITSQTTLEGKRAAALAVVTGASITLADGVTQIDAPADRLDFLNSTGGWANDAGAPKDLDGATTTGLGTIDFWIGGLAEEQMPFGGLLGSTFNFVFETQLEALQDGDRFYYLARNFGLNFFTELEQNSFAKLVMANTDVTHLPDNIFMMPALTLEVDPTKQFTGLGPDGRADPTGTPIAINGVEFVPLVIRDNPDTAGPDANYLQYTGFDHVVLGGTPGDDIIVSSEGDDTVYGDEGNDRLDGGFGNDVIMGGAGDDIITDMGGDDNLQGGDGNDVINAGTMEAGSVIGNLILGGNGKDFIITPEDISTTFGGQGDDFIYSDKVALPPTGNEGDDWIEWGTQDGAPGDNFSPFLLDDVPGNDIFVGAGGFDEMIGEGGDDIFVGSDAQDKMDGMSGFDWVTYKNDTYGVTADLSIAVLGGIGEFGQHLAIPAAAAPSSILDRFAEVEGMSGTAFTDLLFGDRVDPVTLLNHGGATGGALTNLDLIDGLEELLAEAGIDTTAAPGPSGFVGGNIILGGDGGDIIEGRGGDDLIDGDKWLNVRISVRENTDGTGAEIASFDSMTEMFKLMVDGVYNPGQLVAVREIIDGVGGFDTAIFSGNLADYTIIASDPGTPDGFVRVVDNVLGRDGTDTLTHVERLQFADQTFTLVPGLDSEAVGQLTIHDAGTGELVNSPTEGQLLRVSIAGVTDADNVNATNPTGAITGQAIYTWQAEFRPGSGFFEDIIELPAGDLAFQSANGTTFRVTPDLAGLSIRVRAVYVDDNGVPEIVFSAPTAAVVDVPNPPPTGPAVLVPEITEGGEGVHLIRSDLDFILNQIKIAEAHAGGQELLSLVPNIRSASGLRTVSGEFNNLVDFGDADQTQFGAADNLFPRLTDPIFRNDQDGDAMALGPPPAPVVTNTDYGAPGNVVDADPRIISNLIVDQTANNPAAYANAYDPGLDGVLNFGAPGNDDVLKDGVQIVQSPGLDGAFGTADDRDVFLFENVAPDGGLSAPFNAWFTFFGQFFDHGLDLVTKGGNGTIFIPLQPDDPLVAGADGVLGTGDDLPASQRFMVLTRATTFAGPGADGIVGTADDTVEHQNTTSPFVDQNQTYSSHPSHQVFLRAYQIGADGAPHTTGKLIENRNLGPDGAFGTADDAPIGGMATWAVVKAQARDLLGIDLSDADFDNVPLLATDAYGNFIKGPNGFPQVVIRTGNGADGIEGTADDTTALVEGNPAAPIELANAVRTGHQFLADIAFNAVPVFDAAGDLVPDADSIAGNPVAFDPTTGQNLEYDDELLDAHYMAGDGRVNENIGLTAVHAIFHSEHNRLVEQTKDTVRAALAAGDADFASEWVLGDTPEQRLAAVADGVIADTEWNGERLFQVAKFGTEMQYQHLVFEEFARTIQPNIDLFFAPTQVYDVNLDASIVAEFAHTVYRFGHSMLTETVDRLDADFNVVGQDPGSDQQLGLIEAFLNPLAFAASGPTPEEATSALVRGLTREVGNEIDEFVTEALRNNLLGLPLDLPAINLTRGRDAGIPTLNAVRRQIHDQFADSNLKPYTSWSDLVQHLQHPESLINFIAAYGKHIAITSATTLAGKRAAALALVLGDGDDTDGVVVEGVTYLDRLDFLNGTGEWANDAGKAKDLDGVSTTGLGDIDLWIGGLAEEKMPFGGMLGSTFNFVFESQLEKLQDGDRFYYLERTAGLAFNAELESNSFAKLIMANTNTTHLPAIAFLTPAFTLEVDPTKQFTGLGDDGRADPESGDPLVPLVIRDNPNTVGPDTNYLQYNGPDHVVLGGTAGDDILISSEGDDTLYGDEGNDRLEGGFGNDELRGGAGDDIITDTGGDDVIQGGDGNDVIHGGNGVNLILGGFGSDFIVTGEDANEAFGGPGNDFIIGTKADEQNMGNEGDDWFEFGAFDGQPGDNFDPLGNDPVAGNDIYIGGGENDKFNGEGGDDIMAGKVGLGDRYIGASGYDWAIFKFDTLGVTIDLGVNRFFDQPLVPGSGASVLTRFDAVEGLSGSDFGDALSGDDQTAATLPTSGAQGSVLTNIALIDGLQDFLDDLLGGPQTFFDGGNIILGGGGGDLITGRGGDDLIDGDAWLNVRISVRQNPDGTGPEIATYDTISEMVPLMLAGTYNPGQLVAVREILYSPDTSTDTAKFSSALIGAGADGVLGTADDVQQYTIAINGVVTALADIGTIASDDVVTVTDTVGDDGTDSLRHIERLQFSDQTIILNGTNNEPVGALTIIGTPTEDEPLTVTIAGLTDADNVTPDNPTGAIPPPVSYFWQVETIPGSGIFEDLLTDFTAGEVARVGGTTFTPGDGESGLALRVRAVYKDGNGVLEEVFSAPTAPVANVNDAPVAGPTINDTTPTEGLALTVDPAAIVDPDGTANAVAAGAFTFQWQQSADGVNWTDIAGATGQLFVPQQAQVGMLLRVVVSFVDDGGTPESVASAPTGIVGDLIFGGDGGNTLIGTAGQDEIWGLGGADNISALAGNDTIFAGDGADRLDGGLGADTMWGEAGNDIYIVDNAGDQVLENPGEGTDTVQTSLNAYTLAATDVENLAFIGVGSFTGTGNDLANAITGGGGDDTLNGAGGNDTVNGGAGADVLSGGLGDDVLHGGAGDDVLAGGLGNDILNGNTGLDSASYAGETDAFFVDLAAGSARRGSAAALIEDTLNAIQIVVGGSGDDTISGNGVANTLDGGGGNDILSGLGGADILIGGLGNDSLDGGAGNDQLDGGAGDDTLDAGTGSDIVAGGGGNDTISFTIGDGVPTIDGGTGSDILNVVGTGGNNTLDAIFDGTVLTDFEGGTVVGVESVTADLLAGTDRLSYAGTTAGVSVDLTAGTASGFGAIAGIENVTGGSGSDTLIGAGNAAVNNLAGGAGDDTYLVDQGDTITEAAGGGIDSVFTSSASFTLAANVENLTFTGVGSFTGAGNGGDNTIAGGAGTNTLSGGGGSDTLIGNAGVDSLTGGDGADILIGGAGNDVMNGGAGVDNFAFAAGFGNDVIVGFDANPTGGQDLLDVSALGIDAGNFAARVSIADLGADMLVAIDGADSILLQGVNGVGANTITIDDFKFLLA